MFLSLKAVYLKSLIYFIFYRFTIRFNLLNHILGKCEILYNGFYGVFCGQFSLSTRDVGDDCRYQHYQNTKYCVFI